jgi:uncharacterized protein YycO
VRIALFDVTWNPISLLIAFATGSRFTHAAILTAQGMVIDAHEGRGKVGMNGHLTFWGSRHVDVWEIEDQELIGMEWVLSQFGRRYDYRGVLGYLWGDENIRRFYCFELAIGAICKARGYEIPARNRLNAKDVVGYISLAGGELIHSGPAKDYKGGP